MGGKNRQPGNGVREVIAEVEMGKFYPSSPYPFHTGGAATAKWLILWRTRQDSNL